MAFQKRYFADRWQETCERAGVTGLHFHDLRGTTVTMLAEAGCTLPQIVSITGHTLRSAQVIIERYLSRTSKLAVSAIAKFENVLETDFAKRPAKQDRQNQPKSWPPRRDSNPQPPDSKSGALSS
jgi:hypothetical protein